MKKIFIRISVVMLTALPFLFSFTTVHKATRFKPESFKLQSDTIEVGDFQDEYSGIYYSVFADTTTNTVVYIADTYGSLVNVGPSFSVGSFYGNSTTGYYLSIAGRDDVNAVDYDYGGYLGGFY